jgi:hypothetical protein
MLRDAGFREVTMKEVPNEPINALFVPDVGSPNS